MAGGYLPEPNSNEPGASVLAVGCTLAFIVGLLIFVFILMAINKV